MKRYLFPIRQTPIVIRNLVRLPIAQPAVDNPKSRLDDDPHLETVGYLAPPNIIRVDCLDCGLLLRRTISRAGGQNPRHQAQKSAGAK
jgi:hypothetical protein